MEVTQDPNIYSALLPRPGNTDNSWESLIEVDKSNEALKLKAMISNMGNPKQNNPNECVLCRRVLSSKSALQMHYRVHTGERPFKCKICNRTFTAKGNLKTHMGVHRSKPPMRLFPQCLVCHRKFADSVLLQHHMETHNEEKNKMNSEQNIAAEVRDFHLGEGSKVLPVRSICPPGDLLPPQLPILLPPRPLFERSLHNDMLSGPSSIFSNNSIGSNLASSHCLASPSYGSSFSAPLVSGENLVRTMNSQGNLEEKMPCFNKSLSPDTSCEGLQMQDISRTTSLCRVENIRCSTGVHKEGEDEKGVTDEDEKDEDEKEEAKQVLTSGNDATSPTLTQPAILEAQPPLPLPFPPLTAFPPNFFPGGLPLPRLRALPAPSPGFPFLRTVFSPVLRMMLPVPLPVHRMHPHLPEKTTCQICFREFACNSALKIHVRSHTKERPFKCYVCNKAFTTKVSGKLD